MLSRDVDHRSYGDATAHDDHASAANSSLISPQDGNSHDKGRRWPIIIAITLLVSVIITILGLGFAAPAVVEEYAKQALDFEPTDLTIDSITASGVKARIQGDFTLDASKVKKNSARDLGRCATWLAREGEITRSVVQVYLPEHDNVFLGIAAVPSILVDIRNGHTTHIDSLTDLVVGNTDGIRQIASDWLDGRLGKLRVRWVAHVDLKSGLLHFGTKRITEFLELKGIKLSTNTL